MGFRFQRRINLSGGWGINASGSGGSLSYRGRHGSVGTRGFSLRTGIPGLSFRQGWGKNAGAFMVVAMLVAGVVIVARLVIYLLPVIWSCIVWLALTSYDFAGHVAGQFRARRVG